MSTRVITPEELVMGLQRCASRLESNERDVEGLDYCVLLFTAQALRDLSLEFEDDNDEQ
jgi:hypothetical protein